MIHGMSESVKNGVRTIQFNNSRKKNAVSPETYLGIAKILNDDATNDEIVGTLFTGTGDYFTSGNDLTSAFNQMETKDINTIMDEAWMAFRTMTDALIRYPKLLVAVVNGPAVGIGVTMCGLCDIVYATEDATFMTPFVKLGLTIEACASYLLPRIMGQTKANEMLLLGRKFTAQEAVDSNLVSRIIPSAQLEDFKNDLHTMIGELNANSLEVNKKLIKDGLLKDVLHCFHRECSALMIALKSEDLFNNITKFVNRKSKL